MKPKEQESVWGTPAMLLELQANLPSYTWTKQGRLQLNTYAREEFGPTDLSFHFAGQEVGYIQEWVLNDELRQVRIGHFATAKDLKGHGVGEALARGFGAAVKHQRNIERIIFQERLFGSHYEKLFRRLDCTDAGIENGVPTWIWKL